ncbi:hypothetical protein V8F33_000876 [Rhypophila sp. PSN 637]
MARAVTWQKKKDLTEKRREKKRERIENWVDASCACRVGSTIRCALVGRLWGGPSWLPRRFHFPKSELKKNTCQSRSAARGYLSEVSLAPGPEGGSASDWLTVLIEPASRPLVGHSEKEWAVRGIDTRGTKAGLYRTHFDFSLHRHFPQFTASHSQTQPQRTLLSNKLVYIRKIHFAKSEFCSAIITYLRRNTMITCTSSSPTEDENPYT